MKKLWVLTVLATILGILLLLAVGCSSTPAATTTTATTTPAIIPPPVTVVSVYGPVPPFNPGGPQVEITLQNTSNTSIIGLTAVLELNRAYEYSFTASVAQPLLPGASIRSRQTLINAGIDSNAQYDLKISGTVQGGATFSFDQQVSIKPLTSPATPTSTFTPLSQNTSSVKAASGLILSLSIDSTTYHQGDQLTIAVDEMNSLGAANNLAAVSNWIVPGLNLGACGTLNYPFGAAVLQGNFDLNSLKGVPPLQLFDPTAPYSCPLILAGITAYNFQAGSDQADILTGDGTLALTLAMAAQFTAKGSWSAVPNSAFGNFQPGVYTVLAGDEWGNGVVLHFEVS